MHFFFSLIHFKLSRSYTGPVGTSECLRLVSSQSMISWGHPFMGVHRDFICWQQVCPYWALNLLMIEESAPVKMKYQHARHLHRAYFHVSPILCKYLVQKQLCLLEVLVPQAPGTVPSCNHSSVIAVPSCPFDVAFAF